MEIFSRVGLIAIALIVGIIIGSSIGRIGEILTREKIGERVKELYELANPGVRVELVSVSDEGPMYKVLLKSYGALGTRYIETYVTKDGKLLTEGVIFVEESIERIQRLKEFVDCLADKGVKIYGLNNNTATLLQLNLLGRYSTKLYVSCDQNLQACIEAGVSQVPSVVIDGRVESGVKALEWFEEQTGCKVE